MWIGVVVQRQVLERATRTQAASATTSIHFVFAASVADAWSQPRRLESRTWMNLVMFSGPEGDNLSAWCTARRGAAERMHRYISWIAKAGFKAHMSLKRRSENFHPSLWLSSFRSSKQFIRSLAFSSKQEAALFESRYCAYRRAWLLCMIC